jgi:hypothetical protein
MISGSRVGPWSRAGPGSGPARYGPGSDLGSSSPDRSGPGSVYGLFGPGSESMAPGQFIPGPGPDRAKQARARLQFVRGHRRAPRPGPLAARKPSQLCTTMY